MQAVSKDTYQVDVLDSSQTLPVLVDFWGPRCGPCIKMEPWVESLAEGASGKLKVVKLNSAENRRLCIDLRVLGLPTFVLYRDGQEVRRLTGDGCTPQTIGAMLKEYVPELESDATPAAR